MIPTFKQFLQEETDNADKKLYYQRYYVKIMRDIHKQATMKQKKYKTVLVSRSEMDCSSGILFQTILFNMDKAKSITKNNQLGKTNQKQ